MPAARQIASHSPPCAPACREGSHMKPIAKAATATKAARTQPFAPSRSLGMFMVTPSRRPQHGHRLRRHRVVLEKEALRDRIAVVDDSQRDHQTGPDSEAVERAR